MAIVMLGLSGPEYINLPAPEGVLTIPACVIGAPGDALHSGNVTSAPGLTLFPVTTKLVPFRVKPWRA